MIGAAASLGTATVVVAIGGGCPGSAGCCVWLVCPQEPAVSDERISAREAEELAVCFAADARDLFGYACVLARGDRALADDLVQAAFEAAGRAWPGKR